jgi:hypothetical protein
MRFFPPKRWMKWRVALVVILVAIAFFIGGLSGQVYRDWAFVCENTASQKGYRQWRIGLQSGHWYRESRLEQFMRREHPSDLANRWTSYAGTGKNILGQPVPFGHERPGPILQVPLEFFDRYVDSLDDQAKLDLYRMFASSPREEIECELRKVWDQAMAQGWEMQGKRGDRR